MGLFTRLIISYLFIDLFITKYTSSDRACDQLISLVSLSSLSCHSKDKSNSCQSNLLTCFLSLVSSMFTIYLSPYRLRPTHPDPCFLIGMEGPLKQASSRLASCMPLVSTCRIIPDGSNGFFLKPPFAKTASDALRFSVHSVLSIPLRSNTAESE